MLVDTSIWVEHLRHGQLGLVSLLHRAEVQCHPFIIGELACDSMNRRSEILQLLRSLPSVPVVENVENEEVMTFVERHRLNGPGCRLGRCTSASVGGIGKRTALERRPTPRCHRAITGSLW